MRIIRHLFKPSGMPEELSLGTKFVRKGAPFVLPIGDLETDQDIKNYWNRFMIFTAEHRLWVLICDDILFSSQKPYVWINRERCEHGTFFPGLSLYVGIESYGYADILSKRASGLFGQGNRPSILLFTEHELNATPLSVKKSIQQAITQRIKEITRSYKKSTISDGDSTKLVL